MNPKFKYGDKVVVGTNDGIIDSVRKVGDNFICTVKFSDQRLIPPTMEYEQRHVSFIESNDEVCPFCHTRWKTTKYLNNVWKDCVPCNKKSEELIDQYNTTKEKDNTNKKEEDDFGFFYGM